MLDDKEPSGAYDRGLPQTGLLPVFERSVTEARLRHPSLAAGDHGHDHVGSPAVGQRGDDADRAPLPTPKIGVGKGREQQIPPVQARLLPGFGAELVVGPVLL